MRFIFTVVINAVALFLASTLLPGFLLEGGVITPILAATVITLLNFLIKPILKLLSFPLVFLTGGLFLFIINAVIIWLTQYIIDVMDIEGVHLVLDNLLTYLFAAIIFGLANWIIHWFLKE